MKKTTILLFIVLVFNTCFGQNSMQRPKVMVVPEEAFCINAGLSKNINGSKVVDYDAAMRNDDILDVINSFENIMADYGFPLTNLQQSLDAIKEEESLANVLSSIDNGYVMEDDLEQISRVAGADILVKIAPRVSMWGPERKIDLRVSAIDCASKKTLKAFGPITRTSAGSTSQLLKAAVSDNIENFVFGLNNFFEDMKINGREGSIIIKIADTCPLNMESIVIYEGEEGELSDLIELWISEHTINGVYSGNKTSRVGMKFDQVRIPLFGKATFGKNKALSMEDFVKSGLVQLLANYGISVSTHSVGIGKAYLTLGKN